MTQALVRPAATTPPVTTGRRVLYFAWHFGEMCAAMCLGWMVMSLPYVGLATAAGYDDPVRDLPEVATLVAAVGMSLGMALQMRWRRHGWRCIGEMSAAMGVEVVLLMVAVGVGLLSRPDLFAWFHGLMPLAMVVAMLPRLDLYTSRVGGLDEVTRAS